MIIKNAKIVLPDQEIDKGNILIQNGLIKALFLEGPETQDEVLDASGLTAIPGLIDLHVHGACGVSITDNQPDTLEKVSNELVKFGVTGFLWTTMAVPMEEMNQVMSFASDFKANSGAECYGINVEGSFINPERAGSHLTSCIFEPEISIMENWLKLSNNKIKVVTIAPERTSDDFLKFLVKNNIIASIGHSKATYEQTKKALEMGASYFTHLGNASGMIHQREPGLVGAALLDPNSVIEIICDGVHLHPGVVEIFVKTKGWDKFVIVSDGTCVMGLPPGTYKWYDADAVYDGVSLKLPDGTIAGGVMPLNKSLKKLMNFTGCTLSAAVRMTSLKPARVLGIDNLTGSIAPNKIANIALLDKNNDVAYTIVNGKVVYKA